MSAFTDEQEALFLLGERVPVASGNVAAARYDPDARELVVEFHGGGTYRYSGVEEWLARDFARAPSKGRWAHDNLVRPQRPFTRG